MGSLTIGAMMFAALPGWSAEPAAAGALPSGYQFIEHKVQVCAYESIQDVDWESAGDKLAFHDSFAWKFSLEPVHVSAEQAELSIVILRVQATHNGAGNAHALDTSLPIESSGHDDPLLGHLFELQGVTLQVLLDPRSGLVSEVHGGEEIVARIDKRVPAPFPGETPPLDAQSKVAYSSSTLARMWTQMLALPPAKEGEQLMPLDGPLSGSLARHWTGFAYTVSLPTGTDHLDGQLLKDPTPVFATLSQLGGSGQVTLKNNLPAGASGDYQYTVTLNALTQPVVQHHHIRWGLRLQ